MSIIKVLIQVNDFPSGADLEYWMNVDPLQREAFEPLDFPSASSGVFCTPESVVKKVMHQRRVTAKELSEAIMRAMSSKDTFDGYKPVNEVFYGGQP